MRAAHRKLNELYDLDTEFMKTVMGPFDQMKLPMKYVDDLGNAILALKLSQEELEPLRSLFTYEFNAHGRYIDTEAKLNPFRLEKEYFPFEKLPAAKLSIVNSLLDDAISKIKAQMAMAKDILDGPEYQDLEQEISSKWKELGIQINRLYTITTRNLLDKLDIVITILPKISKIGNDVLLAANASKLDKWTHKIFEICDATFAIQKGLAEKLAFSYFTL